MSLCAINFGQSSPASPRENATRRENGAGEGQCVSERRRSIARSKDSAGSEVHHERHFEIISSHSSRASVNDVYEASRRQ